MTYFSGAVVKDKAKRAVAVAPSGFGVRVSAGGARRFILNYRIRGVEFRYTIGDTASWPVRKAVEHANALRQQIDEKGINPLDAKRAEREGTVAAVLDRFIAEYAKGKLRSAGEYEKVFDSLVKPAIGRIEAANLTRADVGAMHKKSPRSTDQGVRRTQSPICGRR